MPRTKKAEEPTKRKSKKQVESDDDDIENEIEDVKKSKKKSSSKKKPVEASPVEDELSDLDAVEDEPQSEEEATNTKVQNTRKLVNPNTPIGELGIEDILSHLIEMGHKGLNPQLKQGAIQLRNQLQSRRPYNQNFQQQRNFVPRGGRFMPRGGMAGGMAGRGGPRQPYQQQPFGRGQPFQPQDDQNIYDQTNE